GPGLTVDEITRVCWLSRAEMVSFSTLVKAQKLFRFGHGPEPTVIPTAASGGGDIIVVAATQ
ncbi:unnamed protein product, partial [Ilex paraguariensis]